MAPQPEMSVALIERIAGALDERCRDSAPGG